MRSEMQLQGKQKSVAYSAAYHRHSGIIQMLPWQMLHLLRAKK